MNVSLASLTIAIFIILSLFIFLFNSKQKESPIIASVYPKKADIKESIYFINNTHKTETVLWEFGNGDYRRSNKGNYKYANEGSYLIRLSVNNKVRDSFTVIINNPLNRLTKKEQIWIEGPITGIVGQNITFQARGSGIEWCKWYLDQHDKVTSRDLETFIKFPNAGEYYIKLLTNLNKALIQHKIKITNPFDLVKNKISLKNTKFDDKGNTLHKLIQDIASGHQSISSYNIIKKNHFCSNPHIQVIVNNASPVDLYSYCQGLQMRSGVRIDKAVAKKEEGESCASTLLITQHE